MHFRGSKCERSAYLASSMRLCSCSTRSFLGIFVGMGSGVLERTFWSRCAVVVLGSAVVPSLRTAGTGTLCRKEGFVRMDVDTGSSSTVHGYAFFGGDEGLLALETGVFHANVCHASLLCTGLWPLTSVTIFLNCLMYYRTHHACILRGMELGNRKRELKYQDPLKI